MKKERKATNKKIVVGGMLLVIIVLVAILGVYNNIKNINNVNDVEHKQATTNVEGENIEEQSEENEESTNEQSKSPQLIFARAIGGSGNDVINSVVETKDNGYLAGGYFTGTVDFGKGITLNSNGGTDSMIIKYDEYGRVEWAKSFGGTSDDGIKSIEETKDGGYIARGYFNNTFTIEEGKTLTNKGGQDGMIIKYNADWTVEWIETIGGNNDEYINAIQNTSDGGCIVGGRFYSTEINLESGVSIKNHSTNGDGMVIKYNKDGIVQWAKAIGGTDSGLSDSIDTVLEVSDGGYIVGGGIVNKNIDLGNNIVVSIKNNSRYHEAVIIKYSKDGEAQWANVIPGSNWNSWTDDIDETSEKGYIVAGQFRSDSISFENGINLQNTNKSRYCDGMIIKYNQNRGVEWAKSIGGTKDEIIRSIIETKDQGYIVGGYSTSNSIDLGDGKTLNSNGGQDGMIIKYSKSGQVQWAKAIGGSSTEDIGTIQQTSDGGYVLGGYFQSATVNLEDEITLNNKGNSDGMIIKYGTPEYTTLTVHHYLEGTEKSISEDVIEQIQVAREYEAKIAEELLEEYELVGEPENYKGIATRDGIEVTYYYKLKSQLIFARAIGGTGNDVVNSVVETKDKGYLAGGYFTGTVDFGKGIALNSNGGTDSMIIKYDEYGRVEWAKSFGGTSDDGIESIEEAKDGGYIARGYFNNTFDIEEGRTVTNNGGQDGMIIKYNADWTIQWIKTVGGNKDDIIYSIQQTSDEGYIMVGRFYSTEINLGNEVSIKNHSTNGDGMLIKYNRDGIVQWAKAIGGTYSGLSDSINTVLEMSDGGYIVGGAICNKNVNLGNGIQIGIKNSAPYHEAVIIKYSEDGEAQWANVISGSNWNNSVSDIKETSEKGYIVVGNFRSDSMSFENGINLQNTNKSRYSDGMIIKYNQNRGVEWAKSVGGTNDEEIKAIIETKDQGYIVKGYFTSNSIYLGDGKTLNGNGGQDGMVIKYSKSGRVQWAKAIGGSSTEDIGTIQQTSDGGYVLGGYFQSATVNLEDEITLSNKGNSDGMIIKYGTPEYTTLTVHHYIEGTTESIKEDEVKQIQVAREYITNIAEDIPEYYELVEEPANKEGIATRDEEIVTYYYKLKEYEYIVNHLEKGSNKALREPQKKTETYGTEITSSNEKIEIDGYEYNSVDKETITIGTEENIINIYYTDKLPAHWTDSIIGNSENFIRRLKITTDGGYIVIVNFKGNIQLENGETVTSKGNQDGLVIKYSREKEIEWARAIGGSLEDTTQSVLEVEDGYIITGNFNSTNISLENGITIKNSKNNNANGMIIKYNKEGIIQWAKAIEGTAWTSMHKIEKTKDGGFIIAGECTNERNIDLGNGIILNKCRGAILIKYNKEGIAQWVKPTSSSSNDGSVIAEIVKTLDEGYIAVGAFNGNTINVGNGIILTNKHNFNKWDNHDGMIIKYNKDGETQWAKSIGSTNVDELRAVAEIRDGCYIVGGYIKGTVNLENGETINTNGGQDGIIVKYSKEGEIQWARAIGSSGTDFIWSIKSTEDGGAIVAGSYSGNIDLGNGVTLNSNGGQDGMLIKYNSEGIAQWAKTIGGIGEEAVYDIELMQNGGILAGGYFTSNEINFGNQVDLVHQGTAGTKNGMLVRYGIPQYAEITVKSYKEGTRESIVPDEKTQGEIGNRYLAKQSTKIPEYYEVAEIPENARGILTKEGVTVTYYYKLKEYEYTVNYLEKDTGKEIKEAKREKVAYGEQISVEDEAIKIGGYEYNNSDKEAITIGTNEEENEINLYYTNIKEAYIQTQRSSEPQEKSDIKENEEIIYTVKINNEGTADKEIEVEYTIPKGTTLVEGSVKVNGVVQADENIQALSEKSITKKITENTEEEQSQEALETRKIKIQANEKEENILEYAVKIEKLKDGDEIKNIIKVDGKELEEITHTYVEPVIKISKKANVGSAIEGQKITYTITAQNIGGLEGKATIKEEIPEGTTFVSGSIKIKGETEAEKTEVDLQSGIEIEVPAKSQIEISYEVIVNKGKTGDIITNEVDEEGNTKEIKIPIITYEKIITVIRENEESELGEDEVTAGDQINYEIRIHNTGTVPAQNIEIKENLPEGTQIKDIENGTQEDKTITWNIEEIPAGETEKINFVAEVEYTKEEHKITTTGEINGVETEEKEYNYKKPVTTIESKVEKTGTDKITSKETKVYYEINFTATVNYFEGKALITLVDTLPYKIDEEESEIAEGKYNAENKTITWTEEIENIDTYTKWEAKEIAITKAISVKYNYEDIDSNTGSMANKINSVIELQEPKQDNPEEYETTKKDEQGGDEQGKETLIEIPAKVTVHHYIYDGQNTTKELTKAEIIEGIIGQGYETKPSEKVPNNYKCKNETPEKYAGKMTEADIEVNYYYELAMPTLENKIETTITANQKENGIAILTKEDGEVTYKIKYNTSMKDYVGKMAIKIVMTLPANIDITKSELAEGKYDETTKTITWTEEITGVDTYIDQKAKEIAKTIKIVYKDQNVLQDLESTIVAQTTLYYPENHTTTPNGEISTSTITDTQTVKQKYTTNIKVVQEWDDNEDKKGRRPESIKITIEKEPGGEIIAQEELNDENNWTYERKDLPKYDEKTGEKIKYIVTGAEINQGDLEYYEKPVITNNEEWKNDATQNTVTIKTSYKLQSANLKVKVTQEGTKEITKSTQEVKYTINLNSEIANYIGEGKTKIELQLPYKIDESKSNLNGGKYNSEKQTIQWEEEIPHINTQTAGKSHEIDITKQITLMYKDIDLSQEKMICTVTGKVELYETEQKDIAEATAETNINVKGKVVVRYVDKQTGGNINTNLNYEISQKVGAEYKTEAKEIAYYDYIESSNNTTGKIVEKDQEVIYYYEKQKISVLVKYQDKDGNNLLEPELTEGQEGKPYKTQAKEIENYRVAQINGQEEGTFGKGRTEITYIYEKIPVKVIVKYLEKETENPLLPEETIEGFAGNKYETYRKVVKNYKQTEPEPENAIGTMKKDETTNNTITVKYYYEKIPSGVVKVKYMDIDTQQEITYKETKEDGTTQIKTYSYEIKGYVGDKYKTEEKQIPYYNLVKTPTIQGKPEEQNTERELTENGETIIYYYKKKAFNISVEKELKRVVFNEEEKTIRNKKAIKIEIVASTIKQANLEVTYSIKVKNTGELDGTAEIVENIPQGYKITTKTPNYWKQTSNEINGTNETLETAVELKSGEQKELEVTLKWDNTQEKFGNSKNTVKITKTTNEANFEETNINDNEATAEIITSIKTGAEEKIILSISTTAMIFVAILLVYLYKKYNKERGRAITTIKIENGKLVIKKE